MSNTLRRVGVFLYRLGMRHEDGNTSVVAYAAGPIRILAGELAASVADVLVGRAQRRPEIHDSWARRPSMGPSTP